ncbi:MAG TPA: hypothetical protein PKV27_11475, partial [Ilumatobacteraceae bacterium]|nr:hypothetical protein [Ilumatobacteraceae bacterium]
NVNGINKQITYSGGDGNDVVLTITTLHVKSFAPTTTGAVLNFNLDLDAATLNLYDLQGGSLGPADVMLVGATVGAVRGSVAIDPILRSKFWDHFGEMSAEGRTLLVTTQYVGEAAYCDYVGLMSDGELLMVDTPDNLRRAAFDGEVLDVGLASEPDDELLDHVAGIDGVIGRPETVDGRTLRVVVDNADEVTGRVDARLRELGQQVTGIDEHFVDYDEAFVRVIQRHRRTDAEELVDVGQEGAG